MQASQRTRYEPILHQRLIRHVRTSRTIQDLRLPSEVVDAIGSHFDEFPDEVRALQDIGGDVKLKWELSRPSYKNLAGVEGYSGTYRLGRFLTPTAGASAIMGWRKEFRDSLLAYGYDQYDIAHALPSVIFHYFKDLDLPCLNTAIGYLEARSPSHHQATKDVIIRTIQGYHIRNPSSQQLDVIQCDWYDGLVLEAAKIHQALEDRYPGFVSLCKAKRRKDDKDEETWPSTAVQMFYADVESTIQIDVMAKLAREYPAIKDLILLNCDALFIPKIANLLPEEVLTILNDYHSDMGIKYAHKPMLERVAIPDIDVAIHRVHGILPDNQANNEYSRWKLQFEATNFYLASEDVFVTIDLRTKTIIRTKLRPFVESRYAYDKDNVKAWIADPQRLTYFRIINAPHPNVCHPEDYNLWGIFNHFRAFFLPQLGEGDDIQQLVDPVLQMFSCIVSGVESHYDYLIKYMADSVQNPGIKRAQYIAMYGMQGVGKNELMERFFLNKIIGEENCAIYGNFKQMFDNFETGWQTKTWVMVHEADCNDFKNYFGDLKTATGSTRVRQNGKNQQLQYPDFFGRLILMTNYVNGFQQDTPDGRRQGLACQASSFRHIPNALQILNDPKVQRAFYDYLMDVDLEGWDPEQHRLASNALVNANFMSSFRREQGNMMLVYMHCALDSLYETYRKIDEAASVQPTYLDEVTFPQSAVLKGFYDLCNFEVDGKRSMNAHVINMAAMSTKVDPGEKLGMVTQAGRARHNFFKGKMQMQRPAFRVNYPLLKNAIQDEIDRYKVADYIDIQQETERIVEKLEKYHQDQLDAGWEFRPSVVKTVGQDARPTKSAHRNKPGTHPAYIIKERGEIVFASNDLEEINQEMGEAWVEDVVDQHGNIYQVLHHPKTRKELELGTTYMRPHGKLMIEKQFPFYIRDRTT